MHTLRSIAFLTALAACGNSKSPTSAPTPSAVPDPIASASSAPSASPPPSAAPSAAPAPKPVAAADVAAACTTTATWDKKEPNKVTFTVKNTSDREVKMCWLVFYFYDAGGSQLARRDLPYNFAIAPGASDGQPYEYSDLAKELKGKAVASIETVAMAARFTDGGELRDEALAPAKRARAAKK